MGIDNTVTLRFIMGAIMVVIVAAVILKGIKRIASIASKIVPLMVALYLIIPVDFIPDAMVGLGQLDDAIVFALGLLAILLKLRKPQA